MHDDLGGAPRYATLRDYFRVVRKHRTLIIAVTLVCGVVALGLAARQDPTYAAVASVSFSDPYQDLNIVSGEPIPPRQTPPERAAAAAATITSRAQLTAVRNRLGTTLSEDVLQANLSVFVEEVTNFVVVRATWTEPAFAARLANTVARQAVDDTAQRQRARFQVLIGSLRKRLQGLDPDDPADTFTRSTVQERIARLQSLSAFSRPAEVARSAAVPQAPVSPRPVRNTLLGLLLGLALGLLAAFGRDSLDRRLRGSREIQEHLGLPLLGVVSHEAMGGVMVNGNGHLSDQELESFRILRTNLDFLDVDRPLRLVVVTSALPEEGKSTVAASLACAQAAAGKTTLLVECDLRRPSLSQRLGLERSPGLAEYLAGTANPQDIIQTIDHPFLSSPNGQDESALEGRKLVCITAGAATPRPAEMLGSERFRTFLAQIREAYEIVVLDSCPLLSVVDTLELVPHTDGVLICVRAGHTTRDQARAAKAALDHFPERPTGIVVTDLRPGEDEDYGFYSYSYSYEEPGRN